MLKFFNNLQIFNKYKITILSSSVQIAVINKIFLINYLTIFNRKEILLQILIFCAISSIITLKYIKIFHLNLKFYVYFEFVYIAVN